MNRRLQGVLAHGPVLAVVVGLGYIHGRYIGNYDFFDSSRRVWVLSFGLMVLVAANGTGFPDEVPRTAKGRLLLSSLAAFAAAVGISLVQLVLGSALLPRYVVLWGSLFAVGWYALAGVISSDLKQSNVTGDRVFAVVSSEEATLLRDELARGAERPAALVGTATPHEVGGLSPLKDRLASTNANVLILNRKALADDDIVLQAVLMHATGTRMRSLSLFYEEYLGKLPVWELEQTSLMFDIGEVHRRLYARQKRIADVLAALLLSVPLLVALPIVCLANVFFNRGPLFFHQERVGRYGNVFTLHKLRSMRNSEGSEWTSADDNRVTPFGRFMRKSHLDELPQVWNVLRGDLSLVGPRPEQPAYVHQLAAQIPFYDLRHLVRPGLTGWAQVKHGYAASVVDATEKLQYDFYYLRRQGLVLDLRIASRTLRTVLLGNGR